MSIKKGTAVRQVLPAPFEGVVTGYYIDQETGDRMFRVATPELDAEGNQVTTEQNTGDEGPDGVLIVTSTEVVPSIIERVFKEGEIVPV
jgi:hypothetical protein